MSPNISIAISPQTLRAMLDYLEEQECECDPAGLAEVAMQEAEARRNANGMKPATPVAPAVPAALPQALPRALPEGPLLVPKLRPDAVERRLSYRRAEDLLLD